MKGARNSLVNLENLSDEQIAKLEEEFRKVAQANPRRPLDDKVKQQNGAPQEAGSH
jgi:hypothetical protein